MKKITTRAVLRAWWAAHRSELKARLSGIHSVGRPLPNKRRALIVGSGELVTLLHNWSQDDLKEFEVISVNFSYLAGLPSDYIFFEPIHSPRLNEFFLEQVDNSPLLKNTKVSINLRHWAQHRDSMPASKINKLFGHSVFFFNCDEKMSFKYWYKIIRFKLNLRFPVHHATHVFTAIDWAISRGYREIVIAGVDLNGGGYFDEATNMPLIYSGHKKDLETLSKGRRDTEARMGYRKDLHPSIDPRFARKHTQLTALDVFEVLSQLVATEADAPKIYVSSKESTLSKFFPVWSTGN